MLLLLKTDCLSTLSAEHIVQLLQPKIEACEILWGRLHAITGADSAEGAIAFWEGTPRPTLTKPWSEDQLNMYMQSSSAPI